MVANELQRRSNGNLGRAATILERAIIYSSHRLSESYSLYKLTVMEGTVRHGSIHGYSDALEAGGNIVIIRAVIGRRMVVLTVCITCGIRATVQIPALIDRSLGISLCRRGISTEEVAEHRRARAVGIDAFADKRYGYIVYLITSHEDRGADRSNGLGNHRFCHEAKVAEGVVSNGDDGTVADIRGHSYRSAATYVGGDGHIAARDLIGKVGGLRLLLPPGVQSSVLCGHGDSVVHLGEQLISVPAAEGISLSRGPVILIERRAVLLSNACRACTAVLYQSDGVIISRVVIIDYDSAVRIYLYSLADRRCEARVILNVGSHALTGGALEKINVREGVLVVLDILLIVVNNVLCVRVSRPLSDEDNRARLIPQAVFIENRALVPALEGVAESYGSLVLNVGIVADLDLGIAHSTAVRVVGDGVFLSLPFSGVDNVLIHRDGKTRGSAHERLAIVPAKEGIADVGGSGEVETLAVVVAIVDDGEATAVMVVSSSHYVIDVAQVIYSEHESAVRAYRTAKYAVFVLEV